MPQEIRNLKLKIIFVLHLVLISLSIMGSWSTSAHLFYNSLFCFTLLWGIHSHDNEEPLQLALIINVISIILDIFVIIFYPNMDYHAGAKFSFGIAIVNLLVRPLTSMVLFKLAQERGTTTGLLADIFTRGTQQSSYEDIDRTSPPAPPDFANAQRI
ncbi:hypothetical protein HHI36_015502 [Cryptolaemus montrouzieri]|uniref:Type-1 angiotensin II receptor-associated protein n=1 Tax=Cryptolaemus montrouzieri TaxID=559131 RepID=A0ABD2N6Y5_9CUCU